MNPAKVVSTIELLFVESIVMTELNQIRIETVVQHETAVNIKQDKKCMIPTERFSFLGASFNIFRTGSTLKISEGEFNTTIKIYRNRAIETHQIFDIIRFFSCVNGRCVTERKKN